GSVFIGGAVVQFLRDNLKFFKESKISEKYASSVKKEDDVVFIPAFAGLGAPYWDMNARGAILGLTRDTTAEQITRAALKSIALQSYELVEAMENDTGSKLKVLKVDGGATGNSWLMQYQSDILGKRVVRPSNVDTTVLGAAFLAGLERGFFPSVVDLKKKLKTSKEFSPQMKQPQREKEIQIWKDSVHRIRTNQ
ncbi:carbohydrate kinase, FGGY family protein, partial [Leptospira interrogans serovar Australis str. 200703203]